MFRRNPTRLEMRMDDVNEFEKWEKDLDEKSKAASCVTIDPSTTKSSTLTAAERIGYRPNQRT